MHRVLFDKGGYLWGEWCIVYLSFEFKRFVSLFYLVSNVKYVRCWNRQ